MLHPRSDVRLPIIVLLVLGSSSSHSFEQYSGDPDNVLETDPKVAAHRAMELGDYGLLMVPDCFMGMPGYEGKGPPTAPPKILGKTCDEILSSDSAGRTKKLKAWAREYNVYIQQHNNQLNKDVSR